MALPLKPPAKLMEDWTYPILSEFWMLLMRSAALVPAGTVSPGESDSVW